MNARRKRRTIIAVILFILAVAVLVCTVMLGRQRANNPADANTSAPGQTQASDTASATESTTESTEPTVTLEGVTVYVGSGSSYDEIGLSERSVQGILDALEAATNWNLSVALITETDGDIKICWSKDSSLYTGLPENQVDEYYVSNQEALDALILDSVKESVQSVYGSDTDVYYADADGNDLVLDDVDATVPADSPYSEWEDYAYFFPM